MPLDGISATFLAEEFRHELVGARLSKIFQPTRDHLFLAFRRDGRSIGLHLSASPSRPLAYLGEAQAKNPPEAPAFCMLLRKELGGSILSDVEQPPAERIFHFCFETRNELGDKVQLKLVVELMGRHSNILLLREDGVIRDAIRHVDHSLNRVRELMPARPYLPPPAQNKLLPSEVLASRPGPQAAFPFLGKADSLPISRLLLATLAGFSPLLCEEVLSRAGLSPDLTGTALSLAQRCHLSDVLEDLLRDITEGRYAPALYYLNAEDERPGDFYSLSLHLFPRKTECPSLSAAMSAFYEGEDRAEQFALARKRLERDLQHLVKNNARKRNLHAADLAEGEKSSQDQLRGELLQSQIYAIPAKAEHFAVANYYEEGQPLVDIPLDPALSPAKNIENYYRRARREKEKERRARLYLQADEAEAKWLDSLAALLERASDDADLAAIRDELQTASRQQRGQAISPARNPLISRNQLLNPGKPGRRHRRYSPQPGRKAASGSSSAPLALRYFQTSEGFLVRVGRNNLANDRLTLHEARKSDIWFHVQKMPGSHVILEAAAADSPRAFAEAASLAAYYSSATRAGSAARVNVDYCPVRNVWKARGARPGQVLYEHYRSLAVEAKIPDGVKQENEAARTGKD